MKINTNITSLKYKIFLIAIILVWAFSTNLNAQSDKTLYYLPIVPQTRNINPAVSPGYRLYIGIPFLSSFKTGFENTFRYDDIFQKRGDSLYLDRDYLLGNLKDKNTGNINLVEELFAFGIQVRKNTFHFRIAEIASGNFTITRDLIRFFLYGNGSDYYLGKTIDLGGNAINMSYYREYSLGYSRQINEKLSLGANLKYLQGIANIYTKKMGIRLTTDPNDFSLSAQTDIQINISSPGIDNGGFETSDLFTNTGNSGFAIDLGGQYLINDRFTVAASLVNLGSISWNSNLKNYKTQDPDKVVTFEGVDLNEFFEDDDFNQDRMSKILDSIADEFGIKELEEKYTSSLPTSLFLNLDYHLTPKDQFGFMFRNQFLEEVNWPSATVAYTRKFTDYLNLMFSYSVSRNNAMNLGVGFAANLGPVQFYLVNENLTAPFALHDATAFTIRFGFNLIFPQKKEREIEIEPEVPLENLENREE